MLVVLVIIGIGISTAVVALRPNPNAVVREEGNRLALLLGLASEESDENGTPLAWIGRDGGYEFQARQLTDQGPDWVVVRGDDLLHPRQLPDGIYILNIRVDGQPLDLGQRVRLGNLGAHDLSVELALGDAHAVITGLDGHFQSALAPENGT